MTDPGEKQFRDMRRDDRARFLRELRELRSHAGLEHAELAARAHYPCDAIKAAEAGPALPDLPVLSAYVRGCGGTVTEWEERWRAVTDSPASPLLTARGSGWSEAADAGARVDTASCAADGQDADRLMAALNKVVDGVAARAASSPPSAAPASATDLWTPAAPAATTADAWTPATRIADTDVWTPAAPARTNADVDVWTPATRIADTDVWTPAASGAVDGAPIAAEAVSDAADSDSMPWPADNGARRPVAPASMPLVMMDPAARARRQLVSWTALIVCALVTLLLVAALIVLLD